MFALFTKPPRKVRMALQEYRELRLYGCLGISCENCKYFRKINEHLATCKRENLMKILWPKYKDEVNKIDSETSDVVNAITKKRLRLEYYKQKYPHI